MPECLLTPNEFQPFLYIVGAKADDFTRLNRLGISISHKQVIWDQTEIGKGHNGKLLVWKKAIEDRNGTLSVINDILGRQSLNQYKDHIDVSKAALKSRFYYSWVFWSVTGIAPSVVKTTDLKKARLSCWRKSRFPTNKHIEARKNVSCLFDCLFLSENDIC